MTPVASPDAPAGPAAEPPPVVGGRFAPIMGLRRNAVDYAESMWRRHGDLVHMTVGPPGTSRDVWWVHHPDGAARVLSGSSWRAYSKRDQVHDEMARWLGPGLLTAEGDDWTRQKRFLQPLFTKVAVDGYADLMVNEIETVVGEWDTEGSPTVDLGLQMQRLTLRVVLPVLPAPQINIGPPVTSLDLDMAPPPQTRKRGAPVIATPASAATGPDQAGPTPERKWTTVRRRELINRQQWAAAAAEEAATKPKTPRKGS